MMHWMIVTFGLGALLLLNGCRVFVEPFVCLGGVCPSNESRIATIPWMPPTLDKVGCQNFDGIYKETGWFGNNKESKESLFGRFDFRLHRDDKNPREAGMQGGYEDYQKIPYARIEIGMSYDRETKTFLKRYKNDESAFYKNAVTSIKQQSNLLEVTLMNANGTAYKKSVLNLDHSQIGCVDGTLIIRTVYIGGGNEGASGYATAREIHTKKLSDGSLQIIVKTREWLFTPSSGLIGMDAKGYASGSEPRKSESTLTFPAAQHQTDQGPAHSPRDQVW
jgi:hypothetical protein